MNAAALFAFVIDASFTRDAPHVTKYIAGGVVRRDPLVLLAVTRMGFSLRLILLNLVTQNVCPLSLFVLLLLTLR